MHTIMCEANMWACVCVWKVPPSTTGSCTRANPTFLFAGSCLKRTPSAYRTNRHFTSDTWLLLLKTVDTSFLFCRILLFTRWVRCTNCSKNTAPTSLKEGQKKRCWCCKRTAPEVPETRGHVAIKQNVSHECLAARVVWCAGFFFASLHLHSNSKVSIRNTPSHEVQHAWFLCRWYGLWQ